MPQKTFEFTRRAEATHPLDLPSTATPEEALDRVLRLPAVASKRFLTTKVDRCVTGAASVCRVQPHIVFLPFEERQDNFCFSAVQILGKCARICGRCCILFCCCGQEDKGVQHVGDLALDML